MADEKNRAYYHRLLKLFQPSCNCLLPDAFRAVLFSLFSCDFVDPVYICKHTIHEFTLNRRKANTRNSAKQLLVCIGTWGVIFVVAEATV